MDVQNLGHDGRLVRKKKSLSYFHIRGFLAWTGGSSPAIQAGLLGVAAVVGA